MNSAPSAKPGIGASAVAQVSNFAGSNVIVFCPGGDKIPPGPLSNCDPACDANGVIHARPGQRPGFRAENIPSAEGAIHPCPGADDMKQAVGLQPDDNWGDEPRALPWAGIKQAFGLPSSLWP
jgi:hypothetical protein